MIFPVTVCYHNLSSIHAYLTAGNLQMKNPTSHLRNGVWCSIIGFPCLRSLQLRHSGSIRLSMPGYLGGLSRLRSMPERLSLFLRRSFWKVSITTTLILKGFMSWDYLYKVFNVTTEIIDWGQLNKRSSATIWSASDWGQMSKWESLNTKYKK